MKYVGTLNEMGTDRWKEKLGGERERGGHRGREIVGERGDIAEERVLE